jgi:zinc protease
MTDVKTSGVTASELADAQSYFVGSFPLSLETPGGLAQQLLSIDLYNLGSDYLHLYRLRLLAVDQAAVQAAAQKYLQPEALVTLVVGPAEKCVKELEKLGPVNFLTNS